MARPFVPLFILSITLLTPGSRAVGADRLNDPPVSGGEVGRFEIAPDGRHVVFDGDVRVDGTFEVFTVPIDGSASPMTLHAPLTAGDAGGFLFSSDGTRVVFQGPDPDAASTAAAIQSAPIDGSEAPIVLSITDTSFGAGQTIVAPGAPWVLYRGALDAGFGGNIYAANSQVAGSQVNVSQLGPGLTAFGFVISNDGTLSVFDGQTRVNGPRPLFATVITSGAAPVQLTPAPAVGGVHRQPLITPDNAWVVYRGEAITPSFPELFSVPADGSAPPIRLHPALGPGEAVYDHVLTPDGTHVVFRGQFGSPVTDQIGIAPVDGSAPPITLNAPEDGLRFISLRGISADGSRLVFRARDVNDTDHVYSVALDGSAPPIQLSDASFVGASVRHVEVAADDGMVFYTAEITPDGRTALFASSTTAAGSQVMLVEEPGGSIDFFEESADGEYVVYGVVPGSGSVLLGGGLASPTEVHAVSLTGAMATQRLSDPFVAGGVLRSFQIAPDSRTVVYEAEQITAGADELFVTRIVEPSGCPQDLAGANDVVDFADLVTLLAGWGEDAPGADLAEPFDVVSLGDLLAVLSAWGPCD